MLFKNVTRVQEHFNSFTETKFIYSKIHPYRLYRSMHFNISILAGEQPSTVTPSPQSAPPTPSALGNHWSTSCLYRFAYTGHFIKMESYTTWSFVTGFFHWTQWFWGRKHFEEAGMLMLMAPSTHSFGHQGFLEHLPQVRQMPHGSQWDLKAFQYEFCPQGAYSRIKMLTQL